LNAFESSFLNDDKEKLVQEMFSAIAPRYDFLNTLLTFNLDRKWRKRAIAEANVQRGNFVLDVCCGTGMFALELARKVGPCGKVIAVDFNQEMLGVAQKNIKEAGYGNRVDFYWADAHFLPFAAETFDAVLIGFALRNVKDIKKVLSEMKRVIKPGGKVVSLELAKPSLPVFKEVYYLYFNHIVPLIGRLFIGDGTPYSYLPLSLKNFIHQQEVKNIFAEIGLKDVKCLELTGAVVAIHSGTK